MADSIDFNGVAVAQVRFARPTDRLDEVIAFYRDALGLPELHRFVDHAGYNGMMLGLPDGRYHLEFTRHRAGSPCPAPSRDNLLVFYMADPSDLDRWGAWLVSLGHLPVPPWAPARPGETSFSNSLQQDPPAMLGRVRLPVLQETGGVRRHFFLRRRFGACTRALGPVTASNRLHRVTLEDRRKARTTR